MSSNRQGSSEKPQDYTDQLKLLNLVLYKDYVRKKKYQTIYWDKEYDARESNCIT